MSQHMLKLMGKKIIFFVPTLTSHDAVLIFFSTSASLIKIIHTLNCKLQQQTVTQSNPIVKYSNRL